MSSFERSRLLNESLRENREYEGFRAIMFNAGLIELRKKRRSRLPWVRWPLAASVAFGVGLAIWGINRSSDHPQLATESSVHSFVSRRLSSTDLVHSKPDPRLLVQTPKGNLNVEVIKSEQVPLIELNNQDLLAAFGKKPAGFVKSNGQLEFLVLEN